MCKCLPHMVLSPMKRDLLWTRVVRETRRVAVVNEAICQGCGACTVTCPSGAMDLKGFANNQIMAEVDAICK